MAVVHTTAHLCDACGRSCERRDIAKMSLSYVGGKRSMIHTLELCPHCTKSVTATLRGCGLKAVTA